MDELLSTYNDDGSLKTTFAYNTAEWQTEEETKNTQFEIDTNNLVSNFVIAYTVVSKPLDVSVASNIDFINFNVDEGELLKSNTDVYENDGGEDGKGQIASNTTITNYVSNNGALATDNDYIPGYEDQYYGTTTVYTIQTSYGYEFKKYQLIGLYKLNDSTYADAMFNNEESQDNINLYKLVDSVYVLVGQIRQTTVNNLPTITIVLSDINCAINLKLFYEAKQFDVVYDANYGYGSTDVMFSGNSVNSAPETRRFIYNVKSNLSTGTEDGAVFTKNQGLTSVDNYDRVGYFLVGFAFGSDNFVKDDNGKIKALHIYSGGDSLSNKSLYNEYHNSYINNAEFYSNELVSIFQYNDTYHYDEMLYEKNLDAGYAWYLSLGTDYANVFGNGDKVTMYAIWCAKTYEFEFDYNDATTGDGTSAASKEIAHWVFDHELTVANIDSNDIVLTLPENPTKQPINTLPNTYRLGYTFDGWYFVNGTFNDATGWLEANQIYNQVSIYNTATSTIINANKTLNNTLYASMLAASSWDETNNKINLYAKWRANSYTIVYDLNDVNNNNDGNTFDVINNNGSLNSVDGVGSTVAYLGTMVSAVVTFDSNDLNNVTDNWAYRYGYKFLGWYISRDNRDAHNALLENDSFNIDLLLHLYNDGTNCDELVALKKKTILNYAIEESSQIRETLVTTAAEVQIEDSAQTVNDRNNIILVHARWQVLDYTINIDLNNWNHIDYDWADADYMIGGLENPVDGNVVSTSTLKFVVTFDKTFGEGKLYHNGELVADDDDITIYIHKKEVILTGTAYEKLQQLIFANGYLLSAAVDGTVQNFALTWDGYGFDGLGYEINSETTFNEEYLHNAYYNDVKLTETPVSLEALTTRDKSGQHSAGDRHDNVNEYPVENSEYFGTRTFTIFAHWTAKVLDIVNDLENSTYDIYNKSTASSVQDIYVEGIVRTEGYTVQTGRDESGRYVALYENYAVTEPANQDVTKIYYLAPRGQYVQTLNLTMVDSLGQNLGTLTITFEWNNQTRRISIVDISVNYTLNSANVPVNLKTTTAQLKEGKTFGEGVYTYYYDSLISYLSQSVRITTTPYYVDSSTYEAWVNSYKDLNYVDYYGETYYSVIGAGAYNQIESNLLEAEKDINMVVIELLDLKCNIDLSAVNNAQTYEVDYYRYIRPHNGSTTTIGEDPEDEETYGKVYWDSEFLNDWDQYEVYQTITYKYGEYLNSTYGYASNFGFDGWYYYQGHIVAEFEEYGSQDKDVDYIVTNSDDIGYKIYDWNGMQYVNRYNSSDILEYAEKQDDKDTLVYEMAYNPHLYDFIGSWTPIVYEWQEDKYCLTSGEGDEFLPFEEKIDDLDVITLYTYNYNEDYADYKFDNKAITGNVSLIGLYVPTSLHKVHYYVLENGKYVERVDSSDAYVLGEKRVAAVSKDTDTHISRAYSNIEYFELGTNTDYYYVGFSAIKRISGGHATEYAALAFLLQFINNENYLSYEIGENGKLAISWDNIKAIIKAGITFNGIPVNEIAGETPVEIAEDLEYKLVNIYSNVDKYTRINNSDYLSDYDVLSKLNIYDDSKVIQQIDEVGLTLKNIIDSAKLDYDEKVRRLNDILISFYEQREASQETPEKQDEFNNKTVLQVLGEETYLALKELGEYTEDFDDEASPKILAVINELGTRWKNEFADICLDAVYKYYDVATTAETFRTTATIEAVINKVALSDLSIIISAISNDYFGYIIKNPSSSIGNWVDGTYFAGWYKVDDNFANKLLVESALLTYNSDTWNLSNYECYNIVDTRVDNDGNVTYIVQLEGDATPYEITQFKTINIITGATDLYSRIDNDIVVFAAFNAFKFEFEQNESSDYEIKEVQWGKIDVPDITGDPYQYKLTDVRYVALNEEEYELDIYNQDKPSYLNNLAKNNNKATALRMAIADKEESCIKATLEEAKAVSGARYIFAIIYNVVGIEAITDVYGNVTYRPVYTNSLSGNEYINSVSSNILVFEDGVWDILAD